jgi:peptide/bleomycin uptake transporter
MIKEYYFNNRWLEWAWGGLFVLFLSLYAQVYMSVLFNKWYGSFYNLFQPGNGGTIDQFWFQFLYFIKIALLYIGLATWTGWFTRVYAFKWRKAITFEYISKWRNVEDEIEGSSQRIQEDAYRFARIVESLGIQVVKAVMTLIAFIPILWKLSYHVVIKIVSWEVPFLAHASGNLVWTAVAATALGMIISWFVGYYLPGLEYNNQRVEAAFRKDLVLAEDNKIEYASPKTLAKLFFGLEKNYYRLFLHYGYFDLWKNLYDQIMIILPYIVAGPSVVLGVIKLGVLVQVSNAFSKVYNSMALFIDNWVVVTELRSIWKRLHEFEHNVDEHNKDIHVELIEEERENIYNHDFGPTVSVILYNIDKAFNAFQDAIRTSIEGFIIKPI